ncbi:hypothetical protein Patl1_20155 [Pistacia atlantica]|uniref:Uncharacterized protein n=1 Tax=Pistacia atlantica TaxID=434234 RepID=A0ACC1BN13_9ROSI|nr:hypothetical protein Patl1_20155 [Pistacia atlantica]
MCCICDCDTASEGKRMWWFNRKGATGFSSSSTAEQVTQGIDGTSLTAIVTGASSGIGTETARVLALRGVHVVMGVRNMAAGSEEICCRFQVIGSSAKPSHVRSLNIWIRDGGYSVNFLLVILGVMATPFMLSKDKIELQFATNHIGHFLLTNLLLDTMKRTARESKKEGRIVNVSSRRHKFSYPEGIRFDKINDQFLGNIIILPSVTTPYNCLSAYGQSKLANVLHANELARRLKEDRVEITANSLHPGAIATNLFRHHSFISGLLGLLGKYVIKNVQQQPHAMLHYIPKLKVSSGLYFADSDVAQPSSQAANTELAKKLWDFSFGFN